MKIYIVRHGETEANRNGIFVGRLDYPLNENGVRVAEVTGDEAKKLGWKFDVCYSSPLSRARQTAELILRHSGNEGTPIITDDRIIELSVGDCEGKITRPGEETMDMELYRAYFGNPIPLPPFPNGESVKQAMKRTADFLSDLVKKDFENVLISTHACAMRCMLNPYYEDRNDFWHGKVPLNCTFNVLEADENGNLKLTGDDLVIYDSLLIVDRYRLY